jgi:hypothetical protein
MGYFGSWLYRDGRWSAGPAPESGEGRWLHLDVHDSDIAILSYAPASTEAGVAYLGFTPRVLFEDESASAPTDPDREAAALGAWFAQECGGDRVS